MDKSTFTMTLDEAEWNIVFNALASRPYAEVFVVVGKLQQQANEQQQARQNAE